MGPSKGQILAVKWIVFDAVGTLLYPTPDVATAYHSVGQKHGSQQSLELVRSRFRAAFREAEHAERRVGGSTDLTNEAHEEDYWRGIVRAVFTDLVDSEACFRELFEHFSRPSAWACFEDVGAALDRLMQRGYQVAVASNFDQRLRAVMDGLPAVSGIQCRIISSEVGFRKPSRGFYEAVLRMTGASADEVLFVGDDEVNDVQGATNAGLTALHLYRSAELAHLDRPLLERPFIQSLRELEVM